ncbi:rho guanine nucleotide exchange factor 39 isoform X1 [Hydra vulgaris]|uniref:rho guanine nucleotide exchange factor 39 isoform X1 n=1 Tax=Hydra vulgaris TaxID=6087 RepID=UPI001F5F3C7D|nr:rho guanine nucleotide exchange factor 39 isoform X1 [Hydra vulgaris]
MTFTSTTDTSMVFTSMADISTVFTSTTSMTLTSSTDIIPTENKEFNGTCLSSQTINAKYVVHSELQHLFREKSVSRKRRKILNEIYQTERTYFHHLTLLTTLFLDPIKVSMVLSSKVIDGIFSNIEAIHSVSANLLEQMDENGVLCALLKLAPYMKLYSLYANNFENAERLLTEWQNKSPDFARLLQFQENLEEMQNLRMRALLITPVQRVPRYRLLLCSLLEHTPTYDPDYLKLKEAYDEISKVATHINECIRQHENFQKMLAIQKSFSGDNAPKVLAPGRFFLKEGPVIKITDRGNSKERTLFLFSDILIVARKESSSLYQCRDIYPLVDCLIEQVMGNSQAGGNLFKIICKENSVLFCSQQEKQAWVSEIKNAINELHRNLSSLQRDPMLSIKYLQKEKRKPLTPLKISKNSSSNQISSRQKKHNQQNSFSTNDAKGLSFLHNHLHNSSMDIENHNLQSFNDSLFYRLHSNSEDRTELAANSNLFTEDEVFISTRLSSVTSANTRLNSLSSKSADSRKSSIGKINWSVTEPKPIECRPSIHSDDQHGKIGCSSVKRMLRQSQNKNIYSKKVLNEHKDASLPNAKNEIRELKETPNKLSPNSCVLM